MTTTKRKSDPNWRNRPSQTPEARAARDKLTTQRRNNVAQQMGFANSGALLAAITQASKDVQEQIAQLLTPS
jgi:hypothetical protein